jgi:putative (di)nucleoside polyphosphate hydrolase
VVPAPVPRRDDDLKLDLTDKPEFDSWRWVDFWYPMAHVVTFKRSVYARALSHLAPFARAVAGLDAVPHPVDDAGATPGRPALWGNRRGGTG